MLLYMHYALYMSTPLTSIYNKLNPLWGKLKQRIFCFSVKVIEYSFSAVNIVSPKPSVGIFPTIKITFFVIKLHQWTHISTKYYYAFTEPTTIWEWKKSTCIKSNTISKLFILIRIRIFSQLNSSEQRISLWKIFW